jgi:hypothetical protein
MHLRRHPFSVSADLTAAVSFLPYSFEDCSPCWAYLCVSNRVNEAILVLVMLLYRVFGPKPSARLTRRRRSKQTRRWRGFQMECLRHPLLTIELHSNRLHFFKRQHQTSFNAYEIWFQSNVVWKLGKIFRCSMMNVQSSCPRVRDY